MHTGTELPCWPETEVQPRLARAYGHAVYPGHALTLAVHALHHFASLDDALAPQSTGWPRMVGSVAVPGAGDGAHEAARLLENLRGGITAADLATDADEEWRRRLGGQSPAFADKLLPGLEQAASMRDLFYALASAALVVEHTPRAATEARRPPSDGRSTA